MAGEKEERTGIADVVRREVEILGTRVHKGVFETPSSQRTQDTMSAIRSAELRLADAVRRGHHDIVGQYLSSTMPEAQAANAYRDLVSGTAGWY